MSNRRRNKTGSILMDMLLTLVIVSLFMPIALSSFNIFSQVERFPFEVQDQIALVQLRRFLNGCRILSVDDKELTCENDKIWSLRASSQNLYLSDGTIIVLQQIDDMYFEVVNQMIWLYYERKGVRLQAENKKRENED